DPIGLTQQEGRRLERRQAILRADLFQGTVLEVVDPEVRRRLRVILAERPPGAIAPGLHTQKNHATAVGEDRPGLPGGLAGLVEVEVPQAAPVGVHEGYLAL